MSYRLFRVRLQRIFGVRVYVTTDEMMGNAKLTASRIYN